MNYSTQITRPFTYTGNVREFCWRNNIGLHLQYPMPQIQHSESTIQHFPVSKITTQNQHYKNGVPAPDRGTTHNWPLPPDYNSEVEQ